MENLECAERVLSYSAKINNRQLLRGEGDYFKKAVQLSDTLKEKKFFISDCIGRTWQEINGWIETWHKAGKVPDMIVLDYIQNIKGSGNAKEALDEYIRKFREMAIRYNFAGVLCSQVNRSSQESQDKSPNLHQLKGTGFLEEHADVVLLLHWPFFYDDAKDKKHFEIHVAKNKMGSTGWLNVIYEPEYFKFSDI
jgi:replicative DNA helicase